MVRKTNGAGIISAHSANGSRVKVIRFAGAVAVNDGEGNGHG
jgi:hypothetical protein